MTPQSYFNYRSLQYIGVIQITTKIKLERNERKTDKMYLTSRSIEQSQQKFQKLRNEKHKNSTREITAKAFEAFSL